METGPCDGWATADDLTCPLDGIDDAIVVDALAVGADVCWALSGRRFGECSVTVYPVASGLATCPPLGPWVWATYPPSDEPILTTVARLDNGRIFDLGQQVSSVDDVTIDGDPFDDWRLEDGWRLVRTDGLLWPWSTDPTALRVSLDITVGLSVPVLGVRASAELACEVVKAITDDADCRLPSRVTSLVRQGVSVAMAEPGVFFAEGRTGLYLVDLFIATYNPNKLASPSVVYSPDRPKPRRDYTTSPTSS